MLRFDPLQWNGLRWLHGLALWTVSLFLLFLLWSFTTPARANGDMPPGMEKQPGVGIEKLGDAPTIPANTAIPIPPLGVAYCYEAGFCISRAEDYMREVATMDQAVKEIYRLRQQLAALEADKKAPPKCATVTLPPAPPQRGGKT
jgi:hypothetical protein